MKKTLLTLVGLAAMTAGGYAQVLYTGNYTQNFNSFGTGNVTWSNNTTLTGWVITAEASETLLVSNNGSTATGQLYNYGVTGSSDRSLGYLGSGNNDWSNFYLQITNNTGSTLTQLSVSYDGRLWRSGGTQPTDSNNTIRFFHISGITSFPDSSVVTGWTEVTQLNYAPTVSVAAGALSGAATTLSHTITGLNIANGSSLTLRWMGNNGSGTDAGLAIDNVSVIPEPTAAALLLLGLGAFAVRRKFAARK